jgi:hypothetical protein
LLAWVSIVSELERPWGKIAPMKSYDLYLYDDDQKVVIGWHPFEQQSDEAALKYAQGLAQNSPMELWQGENLVRSWTGPK